MTKISQGGQLVKFAGNTLQSIKVNLNIDSTQNKKPPFELWLNGESLSYLSSNELVELRSEINESLKEYRGY